MYRGVCGRVNRAENCVLVVWFRPRPPVPHRKGAIAYGDLLFTDRFQCRTATSSNLALNPWVLLLWRVTTCARLVLSCGWALVPLVDAHWRIRETFHRQMLGQSH